MWLLIWKIWTFSEKFISSITGIFSDDLEKQNSTSLIFTKFEVDIWAMHPQLHVGMRCKRLTEEDFHLIIMNFAMKKLIVKEFIQKNIDMLVLCNLMDPVEWQVVVF
jgi:hypothetical protein